MSKTLNSRARRPACCAAHPDCRGPEDDSDVRAVDAPLYGVTTVPPIHEPPYTADRDLYLNKAGAVVEATDPTRLSVLVRAGGTLPAARARELGLLDLAEAKPAADRALLSPENRRRAELIGRILSAAAALAGIAVPRGAAEDIPEEDLEALAGILEDRLAAGAGDGLGAPEARAEEPGPEEPEAEPERGGRKRRRS